MEGQSGRVEVSMGTWSPGQSHQVSPSQKNGFLSL
jgi:hypothetical protein